MQISIPDIVKRLKDLNCVILLGPGLEKNKKREALQSSLNKYCKKSKMKIEEGIDDLYTCDEKTRTMACDFLKEYSRDHGEPNDSHRELARAPCHLYISMTPDLLMKEALDDCGVDYEFKYYVKGQQPEEVSKPTAEKPLLYNLFGNIEKPQSHIFTHGDLIQYLFSIIKDFKLPKNLRSAFEKSHYFIFLGFDFEKWYLKLLLRLILDERKVSIATEDGNGPDEKLKTFYQNNYGLEFVDTNIEEYVKDLFDECDRIDILRQIKKKTQPSIQEEIKKLIKQDEGEQAIDRLIEYLEDERVLNGETEDKQEFLDELIIHYGDFKANKKRLRIGNITRENADVAKKNIYDSLLKIAQNV